MDINNFFEKLHNQTHLDITRRVSGSGCCRYFGKPYFTEEQVQKLQKVMTNNYRKLHKFPLIRKGSLSYKIKRGQSFL